MKLIGNSVSVPVIEMLARAIVATGAFQSEHADSDEMAISALQHISSGERIGAAQTRQPMTIERR